MLNESMIHNNKIHLRAIKFPVQTTDMKSRRGGFQRCHHDHVQEAEQEEESQDSRSLSCFLNRHVNFYMFHAIKY